MKSIIALSARIFRFFGNFVRSKGKTLIDIQGSRMYINNLDRSVSPFLLKDGVYESYTTELFRNLINPGMVVVDIGANIGYFTLIAAQLAGCDGKVYAFEPEQNNYRLLVKNITVNKYYNTLAIQKAVSDKTGKLRFFIDKVNLGGHSLSEDAVMEKSGSVEIESITLDGFLENISDNPPVDLIKMDVEGAEGLVIKGAENTLKGNLKIIMEFLPRALKSFGTDPLELLAAIKDRGFKIQLIDEMSRCLRHIEPVKIIELCESGKGGRDSVNLLLEK